MKIKTFLTGIGSWLSHVKCQMLFGEPYTKNNLLKQKSLRFYKREVKQQLRRRRRKPHLKINISEMDYFVIIAFFLASFIVYSARCKGTGRSVVEIDIENERFYVVCSRCR